MYCIDDRFFDEIEDVIEHIVDVEGEELENFSDDYYIKVECCTYEPIFQLDSHRLYDMLANAFEDRSSEDGEEWDKVEDILKKHIDFEALNKAIPKLWFPNGRVEMYSKNQLIELNE